MKALEQRQTTHTVSQGLSFIIECFHLRLKIIMYHAGAFWASGGVPGGAKGAQLLPGQGQSMRHTLPGSRHGAAMRGGDRMQNPSKTAWSAGSQNQTHSVSDCSHHTRFMRSFHLVLLSFHLACLSQRAVSQAMAHRTEGLGPQRGGPPPTAGDRRLDRVCIVA